MRILFTGASSFTGAWFARALAQAGHTVVCPNRRAKLEDYPDLRRRRLEWAARAPGVELRWGMSFGDEAFLKLADAGPWQLLAHHGAQVGDYKSANFDVAGAVAANTLNLPRVLQVMAGAGATAVLLTGSYFESGEGGEGVESPAASPYGVSKARTMEAFRGATGRAGMSLGKFVVPNPFGPWEEPRFTAYLMRTWREGKIAEVKTPDYLRDNIHVDLLALEYHDFAEKVAGARGQEARLAPSGYVETQGSFATRYAREMRTRLGWECGLRLARQTEFPEPRQRTNGEPAAARHPEWSETQAWDGLAEYYRAE